MNVEVYRDSAGHWRWRARARNGRIIADGAEGYASRRNALRACAGFARMYDAAAFASPKVIE